MSSPPPLPPQDPSQGPWRCPPQFPPQSPPLQREQLIDPYTTIDLTPATPADQRRVTEWLLFGANVGDPAAFRMPTYEQAKLSAL